MLRAVIPLLLSVVLHGCGEAPDTSEFPLREGLHWRYAVTETTSVGTEQRDYIVTNVGSVRHDGNTHYVRRTGGGTNYHFRVDEDGIRRVAKRLVVELEPTPDYPERLVLPRPLELNKQWQNTTHPYVLKRLVSDGVDMRRTYTVPMSYIIDALDATVTVPAGTYENCVLVTGTGELQMYVDGPSGLRSIPLTTREWYAPGVGLVKLEREETVESDLMAGGTLTMELTEFTLR